MKCLETRKRDGMKWRRYRTPDGRIITTFELPTTVLLGAAPADKLKARLASFEKAERTRARRVAVLAGIAAGTKPLAIADEFGLDPRTVYKIKQGLAK